MQNVQNRFAKEVCSANIYYHIFFDLSVHSHLHKAKVSGTVKDAQGEPLVGVKMWSKLERPMERLPTLMVIISQCKAGCQDSKFLMSVYTADYHQSGSTANIKLLEDNKTLNRSGLLLVDGTMRKKRCDQFHYHH